MELKELEKNVENWLNQGFADTTRRGYRWGLKIFLDYLNETEGNNWTIEKLVAARQKDVKERKFQFEQKVVDFYKWLEAYVTQPTTIPYERKDARTGKIQNGAFHTKGGKKLSDNSRQAFIHAVRSFFAYLRLDLQFIKQQKRFLGKKARLVEHDYHFSLKDLEEMVKMANPQEKYIMLAGKDLGLRPVDFLVLSQGHFARALKQRETEEAPILLGEIYTQKEGVNAYPFLTDDGLEAARIWLRNLKSKDRYDDKKPMLEIQEKELTENLKRLAKKAGIDTHGERIRFHCLRKFLIDRLSKKTSESKWKQIVGKQIDEGAYVSPLALKEIYADVMNSIQLPKAEPVNHDKLLKLEAEHAELKETVGFLESMVRKHIHTDITKTLTEDQQAEAAARMNFLKKHPEYQKPMSEEKVQQYSEEFEEFFRKWKRDREKKDTQ
jgi:hypothetical protein